MDTATTSAQLSAPTAGPIIRHAILALTSWLPRREPLTREQLIERSNRRRMADLVREQYAYEAATTRPGRLVV